MLYSMVSLNNTVSCGTMPIDAQRRLRDVAQVLAVDRDAAAVDIVETEQQPRQGRLAGAAVADHGGGGAGGNGEIDAEQDLALAFITEFDIGKSDLGTARHQRLCMCAIGHFAVLVEQREKALHVGQALL